MERLDPLFYCVNLFRRRKFDKCIEVCNEALDANPYDQAFWCLKMRCLTEQVYVDDLEADEEGIAETLLDDNAIAQVARPGTSLKTATARPMQTSQAVRPVTQSGRPLTGVLRPGTQGRLGTMENALKTPRTARTSRPMTSSSGRFVRMGTTSMLSQPDGPFINLGRLNIGKYASIPTLAKPLFEYIYYQENNIRVALELAAKATEVNQFKDWWWKVQLGKCYYKTGMIRDAEKQFRSALKHIEVPVEVYLWLGRVYERLDQPLAALDIYTEGLTKYPGETFLMTYAARIHEAMNEMDESVRLYKEVLSYDAINIEAIASIAMNHFYNDQPEIALRFGTTRSYFYLMAIQYHRYYRRILQMGTCNAQIYNNLGLSCYLSQQFDMSITCFERALMFSDSDEVTADIWYNIGHLAIGSGDKQLASQCFRLALVSNNDHSEAYNNLGVIEMNKTNPTTTNIQQSKAYFQTSATIGKHLYEPHYNQALLAEKMGHYDLSFTYVKKSLELYPDHYSSQELINKVRKLYESV